MKNTIFYFFVFLLFSKDLAAQKISIDEDTIKVNETPYALIKKKKVGILRNDFVLIGLDNTELVYFKSMLRPWTGSGYKFGPEDELYYEVNFIASGFKVDLKHYNINGFAKLMVENNLIIKNKIDPESERRFVQINNGKMYTPNDKKSTEVIVNINNQIATNSNNSPSSKPKMPIVLNGNKIIRNENIIGKFRQDTSSSNYSQKTIVVSIYSEGGDKIAEAIVPLINPQEWSIKILSENKSYSILYDAPQEKENLFKWLADKNYLTSP